jgi:hypothetical protein
LVAESRAKPLRTDPFFLHGERRSKFGLSLEAFAASAPELYRQFRNSRRVLQRIIFIGGILTAFAAIGAARAQNAPFSLPNDPPPSQAASNVAPQSSASNAVQGLELYSGLDLASHGWAFGWAEATIAPYTNADTSGLRLRLYGEGGEDEEGSDRSAGANTQTWYDTDFLIGYAFEKNDFDLELYVGAAAIDARLARPDPTNPVQGVAIGPKLEGEFSWTKNGNMLHGEAYYTTAFDDYGAKLQLGHEIADKIYVGPEFTFLGDQQYTQWRVGGQVTAMNIRNLQIVIGAGYVNDSNTGSGAYGTIQAGVQY